MESSREVRRFHDTAIRATNTAKHSGDGWAERHLEATNFGIPVQRDQRQSSPVDREPTTTDEVSRCDLQTWLVISELTQEGDPDASRCAAWLRTSAATEDAIVDPGGPRVLPVSQEVQHGPRQVTEC